MNLRHVSSSTITALSASLAVDTKGLHPPTRDDLIAQLRARFIREDAAVNLTGAFNRAADVSSQKLKIFESLLASVPDGFELVPVFYSCISKEKAAPLWEEYRVHVRPQFISYLVAHHRPELARLGFSDVAMDWMSCGIYPLDENLNVYDVSIDHILERRGCGAWQDMRANDPQNRLAAGVAVSPLNHFSNLLFMPNAVHAYKNKLNFLQFDAPRTPAGTGAWVLMLAPKKAAAQQSFVCPPQTGALGALYAEAAPAETIANALKLAVYTLKELHAQTDAAARNNAAGASAMRRDFSQRLRARAFLTGQYDGVLRLFEGIERKIVMTIPDAADRLLLYQRMYSIFAGSEAVHIAAFFSMQHDARTSGLLAKKDLLGKKMRATFTTLKRETGAARSAPGCGQGK